MSAVESAICFPNPFNDWGEHESDVMKVNGSQVRIVCFVFFKR